MITTAAPGKLYVAGEYAVVEPGHAAVLVAVDRYVTVTAERSAAPGRGAVTSAAFGAAPRTWGLAGPGPAGTPSPFSRLRPDDGRRDYVMSALSVADELCRAAGVDTDAVAGVELRIDSTLDEADGRKYGFGSSGAVTVAVLDAATRVHGLVLGREDLFRAALLATVEVSPNASGGDVATSTHGGWIRYVSPDREALRGQVAERGAAWTVRSGAWGAAGAAQLGAPAAVRLLVGWTGAPASTNALVARVRRPDTDAAAEYARFRAANAATVERLVAAWSADPAAVDAALRDVRGQLVRLGEAADVELETATLSALCDAAEAAGGAAKLAGAGGGDCGIALLPASADIPALRAAWAAAGVVPLDVAAAPPVDRPDATRPALLADTLDPDILDAKGGARHR